MLRRLLIIMGGLFILMPGMGLAKSSRTPHAFRELIHIPTAGIFRLGESDLDMRIYSDSGIHMSAGLGLRNNFMIGFTLGGENIIGDGLPQWNPQIEFDIKCMLVKETASVPAISVGFDSQGFGSYHDEEVIRYREDTAGIYIPDSTTVRVDRYDIKSRGLFLAITKNMKSSIGWFGLHAGFNISLETKDGDNDLNFSIGMDVNPVPIDPNLFFMFEYDAALNDNDFKYQALDDSRRFGAEEGLGYLNVGMRWDVTRDFSVHFALTDMFESAGTYGREIRMTYTTDLLVQKEDDSDDDEEEEDGDYDGSSFEVQPWQSSNSWNSDWDNNYYGNQKVLEAEPVIETKAPEAKKEAPSPEKPVKAEKNTTANESLKSEEESPSTTVRRSSTNDNVIVILPSNSKVEFKHDQIDESLFSPDPETKEAREIDRPATNFDIELRNSQ